MPEEYLYKNLIIQDSSINTLYKMRVGTNHTYTSDEMFHIPFNLRGLVSTNRYSIPGLPCVYLGSSPLTCWEELNKPDLNTIQTSLYITKDIRYMDLSTPPGAAINNIISFHSFNGISDRGMKNKYKELISYIVVWPLMAACSIRVKIQMTHLSRSILFRNYYYNGLDNHILMVYVIFPLKSAIIQWTQLLFIKIMLSQLKNKSQRDIVQNLERNLLLQMLYRGKCFKYTKVHILLYLMKKECRQKLNL